MSKSTRQSGSGQAGTAHTPGPWEFEGVGVYEASRKDVRVGEDGESHRQGLIALIYERYAVEPGEIATDGANGRLVAAAPDLLAACQAFIEARNSGGGFQKFEKAQRIVEAAIAKATKGEE